MLPHVVAEQDALAVHQRRVLVRRGSRARAPSRRHRHEHPSGAENPRAGVVEARSAGQLEPAEVAVIAAAKLARPACRPRAHHLPEHRVIGVAAAIVAHARCGSPRAVRQLGRAGRASGIAATAEWSFTAVLLGHARMMRRQVAHRVGRARIPGQQKGLAAAAAEIDLAPLATRARLGQEVRLPRKALKAGDWAQMSASEWSRTFQNSRPGIDSAAWHGSTRPDGVTLSERRPPADARLGKARVIVGDHGIDDDLAVMCLAKLLRLR